MNEIRENKFRQVADRRQPDLTVILENVHDLHNVGAVLRSADSVGIMEIFVLQTDPKLQFSNLTVGKRTSAGSRRWVDVHYFTNRSDCFEQVKKKYKRVLAAFLQTNSQSLFELNLTQATALLFGNEKEGLSPETLSFADGSFIIPQMGMAQSLNISVACGVSLYEAFRQRKVAGFYGENSPLNEAAKLEVYNEFVRRQVENVRPKKFGKIDSRM